MKAPLMTMLSSNIPPTFIATHITMASFKFFFIAALSAALWSITAAIPDHLDPERDPYEHPSDLRRQHHRQNRGQRGRVYRREWERPDRPDRFEWQRPDCRESKRVEYENGVPDY